VGAQPTGGNCATEASDRNDADAWSRTTALAVLERGRELRARADRHVDLMVMGVPANPRVLEQHERADFRRVVHWLPSSPRGPVEQALAEWESAIADLHEE
jgi:hypothetical protein